MRKVFFKDISVKDLTKGCRKRLYIHNDFNMLWQITDNVCIHFYSIVLRLVLANGG